MPLSSRRACLKPGGPAGATRPRSRPAALMAAVATLAGLLPLSAQALTAFRYTSSPESWVGGGETVFITPEMGFLIAPQRNFDNGVSFSLNDFATNPDSSSTRWWSLQFAAPHDTALAVGHYSGATRFPFQAANEPGLNFDGNGRGSNQLTGAFSIREVRYAQDGGVQSFAADFVQYDEEFRSRWNRGSIRYNSSVPLLAVPEPSSWALFAAGLAIVGLRGLTKKQRACARAAAA